MTYEILGIKKDAPWMWKKERSFKAIENYNDFLQISRRTGESLEEYWAKTGKKLEFVRKNNNQIQYWIPPRERVLVDNNWLDIKGYSHITDYPTENSEELLERVLQVTNKGDIVLDCYAGSGTTGVIAEKLHQRWIMCDASKLAIYTMQKRMLNLKEEIGNKGKALQPKPFVLYNAGLYLDSEFIEKMEEEDYKKFVLELFSAELSEHKIKGVQFHGILNNRSVMVFSQKDYLTYEFIDDLHKTVGSGLKDEMYIIVPQGVVRFNEDYIDKRQIRYHILRVPYSIIQKILEKGFWRGRQPFSKAEINQTIESVGFDFIYPPKVECEYYRGKEGELFDQLVIRIKKFEPVQISKKPVEFQDPKKEALSIVMIDENYDGKVFDMDHYFFGDEIVKNDFKVVFPSDKVGEKIMIIYLDVLGNEKVEVKDAKDFKKK
jgi:site-specific DNA-methyltransferase (adenine-specific)/adenine-specific DNA-methyltransferase